MTNSNCPMKSVDYWRRHANIVGSYAAIEGLWEAAQAKINVHAMQSEQRRLALESATDALRAQQVVNVALLRELGR